MIGDLTKLAEQIRNVNPTIVAASEQVSDESCPFLFRQSFSFPHSYFRVTVAVSCKIVSGGWELSSNIVASNSGVLAKFDSVFVSERLSSSQIQSLIDKWVCKLCTFLSSCIPLIVDSLKEAHDQQYRPGQLPPRPDGTNSQDSSSEIKPTK